MARIIEKVSAFITRQTDDQEYHLLLIEHPFAGIQIPAGTVETTESPEQAVLREVFEETGLTISSPACYLGYQETQLAADKGVILPPSTVYARPDTSSFDWICIRSGVQVKVLRKVEGFSQITYIEHDKEPDPNYVTLQITGWVPDERLAKFRRRHFFHIQHQEITEPRWMVFSDHHSFTVFWAPMHNLPAIIPPQDNWLKYLTNKFKQER